MDFLTSMRLVRTQFEQEIELKQKRIKKIVWIEKIWTFWDHKKSEGKQICDLRQKINEMEQKKLIRKLNRIKAICADIKKRVSKEVKKIENATKQVYRYEIIERPKSDASWQWNNYASVS